MESVLNADLERVGSELESLEISVGEVAVKVQRTARVGDGISAALCEENVVRR